MARSRSGGRLLAVVAQVWSPALTLFGVAIGLALMTGMGLQTDAMVYRSASVDMAYGPLVGEDGAFLYSPAFVQVLEPFRGLSLAAFVTAWRLMELGALALVAGPWTPLVILTVPVTAELMEAQVHLIMAAAIIAAWRWPGAWAIPLLIKPTVGVGLLYHVGARQWRPLGLALGTTAAVAAISFVLSPSLWLQWAEILIRSAGRDVSGPLIGVPLLVRLPVAAALAWYAGRRGWPRLVPIAATIALPVLWIVGLSMAVASLARVTPRTAVATLPSAAGARPQPEVSAA